MKKSSFLHKPKDMLSRSFKPAKCKMSLKLAVSRIKLLKNKKEVQVKQMKRELAQLLDSGQDRTARIRVEHVIREEKMMSAYDLIEIYCELIVARLQIIETQKNCPIDLKEAIASVIFASPRCGDIPELLDVQKHFTAKYGKEFTSAAIELRPNCGVSRMLVEKLSANAPDGPAKIKVLTAIAEEHNIKWDPKAFGESETLPSDLLNGPSNFENANKLHAEVHSVPDVQGPPSSQRVHNQPFRSSEQNVRSSHATQNLPTQVTGVSNGMSSLSQPELRPSGNRNDKPEINQEFHGEGDSFSYGQQSWNMEFKDATSAAQAAAESAERASMAARAALELSSCGRVFRQHSIESHRSDVHGRRDGGTMQHSAAQAAAESAGCASMAARDAADLSSRGRVSRQHSTESHRSEDIHGRRDGGTVKHSASRLTNGYCPKDSANIHTRVPHKQNTESERSYQDDPGSDLRFAQTSSSRSKGPVDEDLLVHNVHGADEYPQKILSEVEEMGAGVQIHSDESEAEYGSHLTKGFSSGKFDYYGEERTNIQSSTVASGSYSSVCGSDDKDLKSGNTVFEHDFDEDHSGGIDGHMYRDSLPLGSRDTGHVTFDESGSDGEDFGIHMGSHHEEYVPSPGRNSTTHFSADIGTGSLFKTSNSEEGSQSVSSTKRNSSHEFSGSVGATANSSEADHVVPVTYDDSDGQSSEDETDVGNNVLHKTNDSGNLHSKGSFIMGSVKSSFAERSSRNDQRAEITVGSAQKFGSVGSPTGHSSPPQLDSDDSDSEPLHYSPVDRLNRNNSSQSGLSLVHEVSNDVNSSHSHGSEINDETSNYGKELNFGKLTGGLRHKGYTQPPYVRSELDNSSSVKGRGEESPSVIPKSYASPAVESSITGNSELFGNKRGSRVPKSHYDSDTDSFEEIEKQPSSRGQEPYMGRADKDVKAKSNARGPAAYFGSESSDSENDSAKQVFTGRGRWGTGVSRRTKVSTPSSKSTNLKGQASSMVVEPSEFIAERKPTISSYGAESPQPSQSYKHSGHIHDMQPSSSGKLGSKTTADSRISSSSSYNKNRASHGAEEPINTKKTPEASGSAKIHKISNQNFINREDTGKNASQFDQKQKPETKPQKTVSREDSGKRASHVHPNLPDYDTLAARIQALQMNRR